MIDPMPLIVASSKLHDTAKAVLDWAKGKILSDLPLELQRLADAAQWYEDALNEYSIRSLDQNIKHDPRRED